MVYLRALVAEFAGLCRADQRATAGRLTRGSSPKDAMVSSVMYLDRWTAHSSLCSRSRAPTSRTMASSLGKMPTTSVRRLISPKQLPIPLRQRRGVRGEVMDRDGKRVRFYGQVISRGDRFGFVRADQDGLVAFVPTSQPTTWRIMATYPQLASECPTSSASIWQDPWR